jgi:16S rRNA (guanine527-N7)-methyltransferase
LLAIVTNSDESAGAPSPPPGALARAVFGDRLELASRYADLLTGDAVRRGLIGPREGPRIWDRHLINCAVVAEAFPLGARVVDVGSGAGLPGLVLACVRSDLRIDLVDSLRRRTGFLTEAIDLLGLGDRVQVVTGRAEERAVRKVVGAADWVTARAVAPLDRLAGWCLPLLVPGGVLIALKGASADDEARRTDQAVRRAGARSVTVVEYGAPLLLEPTRAIRVVRR